MTHVPTTTQHSPWGPSDAIIKPTLSYDEALIDYDALPSLALKKELPPKTPPPPPPPFNLNVARLLPLHQHIINLAESNYR